MKKLFITLTAAIAAMSASAATYTDQIVTDGCTGSQDAQVIITPAADGTYSFTLNEWTCMTSYLTGIGCFTLDGLTATVADGITTITGTGNADFTAGQTPGVMMWFCSYCQNAPVTVTAKFTADKCYAEVATTMTMYTMENSYRATFGTDDFQAVAPATSFTFDDQIVTDGCTGSQDAQVVITPAADGTYSFTLNEWTCMTSYLTGIGCFTLDGLTATEANGVTTLTGTGNADFTTGQTPGVMMWFCSYCKNAPVTVTAKFTADKCYAEVATTMNMYGMENSYRATFGTDDFATTALHTLTAAPTSQTFDLQGRRTSSAAGLRINGGKLTLTR